MVLRKSQKSVHVSAAKHILSVVRSTFPVFNACVGVCLSSVPKESGGIGESLSEVQSVIEQNQLGRIFAALLHHADKLILLLLTEIAADGVHLKQSEIVVAAKGNHKLVPCLCLFRCVAESVGAAPHAQLCAKLLRHVSYDLVSVRVLRPQLRRIESLIGTSCSVKISRIPCVNIKLHPVLVLEISEIVKILQGLLLGGALVGAVYPRKILCL